MGFELVALLVILSVVWGLSYWGFRAERDRSAFVGLYLVYGLPGALLVLVGLALALGENQYGPPSLALGLGLSLPMIAPVRKLLANVTPINAESRSDMAAMSVILGLTFFMATLTWMQPEPQTGSTEESSVTSSFLIVQALAYVGISLAAIGFGFKRNWRASIDRLGLTAPTGRVILVAFAFLALAFVVSFASSILTSLLQPEYAEGIDQALENMTTDIRSPAGALLLGLSAGIGEEIFFRGAIQPKAGIVLTSILFALLHTQYGFSWTMLGVLLLGALLGYERMRYGTTAAIITHTVFNTLAVLAMIYA